MRRRVVACLLLAWWLSGCGLFGRRSAPPPAPQLGAAQIGTASWYGPGFHGNRTSSGEIYDQYELTAAHQTLPLGSRVAVTNLQNGRQVEVRVNDRGPFVKGRSIDLSYAAARALGMIGPGTVPVRIELLGSEGGPLPVTAYAVQVGSFADRDNATRLQQDLARRFASVYVAPLDGTSGRYYRVRLGHFERREDAVTLARSVTPLGLSAIIVEDSSVHGQ
ncbi:MAG: putative lipoprotein, RlpA-like [Deltaproteobacteria bacterium]|nr:putative lipoprotein, RlpA-like [Deltaproteobacteria bacterium]